MSCETADALRKRAEAIAEARMNAESDWAVARERWRNAEARAKASPNAAAMAELQAARRHADATRPGIFRVIK